LGEYQKAIDDYTRAIELGPEDAWPYNSRGNAYDELGQYQKAIDDYTRAIEIDQEYVHAYNNRGIVYENLEQYQKAINDYYQAGILYLKQKNKTNAQKYIDWIKKIDSSSPLIDKLQNQLEQM